MIAKALRLAALALLLAAPTFGYSVTTMKVQPGYLSMGVRVFCAGSDLDTTQTQICQLYVRPMGGDWWPATTAYRRSGTTGAFDGIVLDLKPGTTYDVRAGVRQGASGFSGASQRVTTRCYQFSVTGPMVYVSNAGVDAANTTCSAGSPCKTIHHADSVMVGKIGTNPNQGRGGAIVLRPGVYRDVPATYNNFLIGGAGGSATPDTLYHLTSDGTNPDSTIIDCTEERQLTWTSRPIIGVAGDSCWVAAYASADSTTFLERGWGDIYPMKADLAHLHPSVDAAGKWTGARGWVATATGDSLIVKTPDGLTPGNTTWFHLGYRASVQLVHPYWAISNLTIRGGNSSAVTFGLGSGFGRGSGTVLDSVLVLVGNGSGLLCNLGQTTAGWSDSILVRNCRIEGRRGSIPYPAFQIPGLWGHGIQFSTGFANTAYNNVVRSNLSGYEPYNDTQSSVPADTITSSDNYLGFNSFLENVTSQIAINSHTPNYGGINQIYEGNLLRGHLVDATFGEATYDAAFDFVEPAYGMTWLVRNICWGTKSGISIHSGNVAKARIALYHNTISGYGQSYGDFPSVVNTGAGMVVSRNNNYVAKMQPDGSGTVAMRFDSDADTTQLHYVSFDYDLIDTTAKNYGLCWWGSPAYSIVGLRTVSGREVHGIQSSSVALFDSTRASLWPGSLKSTGAGIDKGAIIPGINTRDMYGPRFSGSAPDIGAYEYVVPDSLGKLMNPRLPPSSPR